ncbi:MAG: aminoacyl-tRNA hydrolase [bacterium]
MKIIAGLGNPDYKYHETRHNFGWLVLDKLAETQGLEWEVSKKFKAYIIKTDTLLLIKPTTYMNNSGQSIRAAMDYYKLLPKKLFGIAKQADLTEALILIHDDLDIELGKYKISTNSGSAGHKGVESVINHLKTKIFTRIRVGIRTPLVGQIPPDKFVLQKFTAEEMKIVDKVITEIISSL